MINYGRCHDRLLARPCRSLTHDHRADDHSSVDWTLMINNPYAESVKIADLYAAAPTVDPDCRPAYAALAAEVAAQWASLPVTVIVEQANPYPTHHDLFDDIDHGTLRVMATGQDDHPIWSAEENDRFRAVHDYYGHFSAGVGFDRHGEYAAWIRHMATFGHLAQRALTTETRGQTSSLITSGSFPTQKAFLLPEWTLVTS